MPKRSNDFQRLIYLVRVNLSEGSVVTESKLLRDRRTKALREVDVVIEGSVGGQKVRVCIECRDHKRIADVQWVEQMKAKHERLDTNALMLASRSGFTKEARTVAESYGIDVFTLEEPQDSAITERLSPASTLWLKTVRIAPSKVLAIVGDDDGVPTEDVVVSPDNTVYEMNGAALGSIYDVARILLNAEVPRHYFAENATEDHRFFELEWTPPPKGARGAIYMQKLQPFMLRVITKIKLSGPCSIEIGRFDLKHGRIGSLEVSWGKARVEGKNTMAVATRDQSGKNVLSINFSGPAEGVSPK